MVRGTNARRITNGSPYCMSCYATHMVVSDLARKKREIWHHIALERLTLVVCACRALHGSSKLHANLCHHIHRKSMEKRKPSACVPPSFAPLRLPKLRRIDHSIVPVRPPPRHLIIGYSGQDGVLNHQNYGAHPTSFSEFIVSSISQAIAPSAA